MVWFYNNISFERSLLIGYWLQFNIMEAFLTGYSIWKYIFNLMILLQTCKKLINKNSNQWWTVIKMNFKAFSNLIDNMDKMKVLFTGNNPKWLHIYLYTDIVYRVFLPDNKQSILALFNWCICNNEIYKRVKYMAIFIFHLKLSKYLMNLIFF